MEDSKIIELYWKRDEAALSEAQHSLYRPFCLAEAVYPETVPYADWDSYYNEKILSIPR